MNVELQLGEGDPADPRSPLPETLRGPLAEVLGEMIVEIHPELEGRDIIEISLAFVTADEMAELNGRYRGIEETTDVLSFAQWEDEEAAFRPPDWPVLPLGDVIICDDVVRRGAEERSLPILQERVLVIVHGALHLLGLDHGCDEEETLMWEIQDRYRDKVLARLKEGA